MSKRFTWCLVLLALFAACQKFAEGREMFCELLALRDQIASEFHESVVDVNVASGDRITIKFINSPLTSRSREEKQKRADEVATYVVKHYKHPLSSVSTVFVSQAGGAGVTVRASDAYVGHFAQNP